MEAIMVKVREHIVNLQSVADAHWEVDELFLHFDGGRFARLKGKEAKLIWSALDSLALDLDTGEVAAAVVSLSRK